MLVEFYVVSCTLSLGECLHSVQGKAKPGSAVESSVPSVLFRAALRCTALETCRNYTENHCDQLSTGQQRVSVGKDTIAPFIRSETSMWLWPAAESVFINMVLSLEWHHPACLGCVHQVVVWQLEPSVSRLPKTTARKSGLTSGRYINFPMISPSCGHYLAAQKRGQQDSLVTRAKTADSMSWQSKFLGVWSL